VNIGASPGALCCLRVLPNYLLMMYGTSFPSVIALSAPEYNAKPARPLRMIKRE
jgi:hypothetical protein